MLLKLLEVVVLLPLKLRLVMFCTFCFQITPKSVSPGKPNSWATTKNPKVSLRKRCSFPAFWKQLTYPIPVCSFWVDDFPNFPKSLGYVFLFPRGYPLRWLPRNTAELLLDPGGERDSYRGMRMRMRGRAADRGPLKRGPQVFGIRCVLWNSFIFFCFFSKDRWTFVCKNPGWCLVKGLRQNYVKHNMYCKDLNGKIHTWKAMSGTQSQEWFSRFSFLGVSFYQVPFEVKLHDLYLVTTLSVDLGCHWSFLGSKNRTGRPCENCSHDFFWSDFFLLTPKVHIRTRWFLAFFFSKHVLKLDSLRKKRYRFFGEAKLF